MTLGSTGGEIVHTATGKRIALTKEGNLYILELVVAEGFPRPGR